GTTAGMLGRPRPVLGQGIDDPDHGGVRQSPQDARVIGPHHARADHADSHPVPLLSRPQAFVEASEFQKCGEARATVPISRLAGRSKLWKTQFAALGYQAFDSRAPGAIELAMRQHAPPPRRWTSRAARCTARSMKVTGSTVMCWFMMLLKICQIDVLSTVLAFCEDGATAGF